MFRSTVDVLKVIDVKVSLYLDKNGDSRTIAFDILKTIDMAWWQDDFLHNLQGCGISGRIFSLTQSFSWNREIKVLLKGHPFYFLFTLMQMSPGLYPWISDVPSFHRLPSWYHQFSTQYICWLSPVLMLKLVVFTRSNWKLQSFF